MADTYNAPELANFYCYNMCPLGKRTVAPAEMRTIDRLTIRIVTALSEANEIRNAILEIVKDGEITSDEQGQIVSISNALEQIAITAQEMKIWVAKNLRGGKK